MQMQPLLAQLKENLNTICQLTQGVDVLQARWKPDETSWSILEVINHLLDEEQKDFRVHLDIILHDQDKPWPLIDPQAWVTEFSYNQRDLSDSLEKFVAERAKSIAWLESLSHPNWQTLYTSPFGSMKAGDMFSAWVAHDLLHIRQLVELHYAYLSKLAEPFAVEYAGKW